MKKYGVLSILLIFSMVLVSCSDDDDKVSNSNIVGKWQLTEVRIDGKKENPNSTDAAYNPCDYDGWIKYNANGTADEYDACENKTYANVGTWEIKNNIMTLVSRRFGIPITVNIIELSSTTLVYEFDFVVVQRLTWKRIE